MAIRAAVHGLVFAIVANTGPLYAQHASQEHAPSGNQRAADSTQTRAQVQARIGAMAIGALTRAAPAIGDLTFTEGYLTQPNAMGDASWRALTLTGTVNLEAYTLRRGELTLGSYGEGYVDRRHPHTLVHEAVLTVTSPTWRGVSGSLSSGKGFVSYGTDDPMMRPFIKYPANHHHAQILERAMVVGALRFSAGERDVTVEHAQFNGDEPTGPFDAPTWSRVGDSRATRLTVRPLASLELQASAAHVESPELVQGGAASHAQRSVSARWSSQVTNDLSLYGLAEYASTEERYQARQLFSFESVLVEGLAMWRDFGMALRLERTSRPEHERLPDPFRAPLGHAGFQLNGITQFRTATVQLRSRPIQLFRSRGGLQFVPVAEVARSVPSAVLQPTVFEPREFYGRDVLWNVTVGLRLHAGTMRARMGRYGVALPAVRAGQAKQSPQHLH